MITPTPALQLRALCARSLLIFTLALTLGEGTSAFSAQTFSWLGVVGGPGAYKWSAGGNWGGGVAPPALGASDISLLFDGVPAGLTSTHDLDKFALNQLTFGSTAGAYAIEAVTASSLLTFVVDGAVTPAVLNDSSSLIKLKVPVSFESGLQVGGAGTGAVEFTASLTGRGVLTKTGPGVTTFNSAAADIQLDRLVVEGGVFNIVGGTNVLANVAPTSLAVSTVTGGGTINIAGAGSKLVGQFTSEIGSPTDGFINVTAGGRLESFSLLDRSWWGRPGGGRSIVVDGSGSTWEHVGASPTTHRMRIRGAATTITVSNGGAFSTPGRVILESGARLTVNGGTAMAGGLESFSGPSILELSDGGGGTSALTINEASSSSRPEYADIIADGPGGAGSVTMLQGEQAFTNVANSYSGGTRLLGGMLFVPGEGALGTGDVLLNGGALVFTDTAPLQRTLAFGANGGKLGATGGKTLTVDQALSLTTPLSIVDAGTVRLTGANQYGALHLEGTLELTNAADATLGGALTGNGGTLKKYGAGVLTLTESVADGENFNDAIVAVHEGALRLTDPNAMNVSILDAQKDDGLILDLGSSPAIVPMRGLRGAGSIDIGPHSLVLGEDGSSLSTQFTGAIHGTGSVTLERGGQLMGVNAYTGGTILKGGVLTLVPGTTTGDIDGSQAIAQIPTLILQQNVDATYAGNILGVVKVNKHGAGKLTLTGEDYRFIRLDVLEGELAMAASPNGHFTDSGDPLTLFAGTTFRALSDGTQSVFEFFQSSTLDTNGHRVETGFLLGGSGHSAVVTKAGAGVLSVAAGAAVGFNVTGGALELTNNFDVGQMSIFDTASLTGVATLNAVQVLLKSGGAIAPGLESQPIGVLQTSNLLWNDGGAMQFDLDGAGSADRLALSGFFGKGDSGVDGFSFDFTGASPVDGGLYLLATFGGTDFDVSDFAYFGLAPGASGVFELQSNALYFHTTVVPEPGAWALLATCLSLLPLNRRLT